MRLTCNGLTEADSLDGMLAFTDHTLIIRGQIELRCNGMYSATVPTAHLLVLALVVPGLAYDGASMIDSKLSALEASVDKMVAAKVRSPSLSSWSPHWHLGPRPPVGGG